MFKDKVYEDLDDISKLVEPYQYVVNEELSRFPDEIEISQELMTKIVSGGYRWSRLGINELIREVAWNLGLKQLSDHAYELIDFFSFRIEDPPEDGRVILDMENNRLSRKIFMVKDKLAFEDSELEKIARKNIIGTIKSSLWSNSHVNKSRLNELADLYGAKEVKGDRSFKGKVNKFCNHLESLMDDKKLDIRDIELSKKFGEWIVAYVKDGNLPALNNVTRIKIMTHENRPIYSIEERSIV